MYDPTKNSSNFKDCQLKKLSCYTESRYVFVEISYTGASLGFLKHLEQKYIYECER